MISLDSKAVLVIGARGMLGSMVVETFKSQGFKVSTSTHRWPTEQFKKEILDYPGIIINCAGTIPQQQKRDYSINFDLPFWLASKNKKFIQPCTDCVYDGKIKAGLFYDKKDPPNATDNYGYSKRKFAEQIYNLEGDFKVIRTSIIGFDYNHLSLLSWFLEYSKTHHSCDGYLNHYWNGITTLEWSKIAIYLIKRWNDVDKLIVVGTAPISKCQLLENIAHVFEIKTTIKKITHPTTKNKCLKTDIICSSLINQLKELKKCREN